MISSILTSDTHYSSNNEMNVNVNLSCFYYQRLPTNKCISINDGMIIIYFPPCSSFSPLNRTGNGENDGKSEQLHPLFQHFTNRESIFKTKPCQRNTKQKRFDNSKIFHRLQLRGRESVLIPCCTFGTSLAS